MKNVQYLNSKYLIPATVVGAVIILGAGGFFYFQSQKAQLNSPQAVQQEVKKIVAEVGKLIELPTGEDPTVATVTDVSKLQDQPFFQKAKNGMKVLIYTNAKLIAIQDIQAKYHD